MAVTRPSFTSATQLHVSWQSSGQQPLTVRLSPMARSPVSATGGRYHSTRKRAILGRNDGTAASSIRKSERHAEPAIIVGQQLAADRQRRTCGASGAVADAARDADRRGGVRTWTLARIDQPAGVLRG